MNNSPLNVVGLFDPQRQQRLLGGLAKRALRTEADLASLHQRLQEQEHVEVERLDLRRHETMDHCREQRREMLQRWDEAEEKLTVEYETKTIKVTTELTRLGAFYRQKLVEEKKNIERKVQARRGAVLQQYENRRHAPGQVMRQEVAAIDQSLTGIQELLELARTLTIRRLDRLPEVTEATDPKEIIREPNPTTVREAIDSVGRLERKAKDTVDEMHTGFASKVVDSFYLPAGVAIFILIWVLTTFVLRPDRLLLWASASVPVAGAIGFTIYGILLMPLRKMTRRLYPNCERLLLAAEHSAAVGRKIAAKTAQEAAQELIERRDSHLAAAERWQHEQIDLATKTVAEEQAKAKQHLEKELSEVASHFTREFNRVGKQMRGSADHLAQEINQTLHQRDYEAAERKRELALARESELNRMERRLKEGIQRGLQRIELAGERLQQRFPTWNTIAAQPPCSETVLPCLPIGQLLIGEDLQGKLDEAIRTAHQSRVAGQSSTSTSPPPYGAASIPGTMPVVLHRQLHSGLIIHAHPSQMDQALDMVQSVLWRLLTGVMPGRSRLTLIDPIGRGQNFASFMAMTDIMPELVGHRVWSGERQIEERLSELAHHAEDILQVNLRDRYERIEDYNAIAGSMFEPYRAVAAIGFPDNLTREGYRYLRALIDSGRRCGTFVLMVCDASRPWPTDMPLPDSRKLIQLQLDNEGKWCLQSDGLAAIPFQPLDSPPAVLRGDLIKQVGNAAAAATRVIIPFESIASGTLQSSTNGAPVEPGLPSLASTDHEIAIPIGVVGARRIEYLRLGEGVRQHVLIAGKTGSGKSSLLHTLITAGAARYSPDQLQFYLLDFKKGVEFKVYADSGLPHARVIGIESEREFGRSVLQRLDAELQSRGERFRAAAVQELSEYRARTGEAMPRVMLVVDEFQELFSRDDRLAADCTVLLDRLVRQGRSFGMHVVLSSQSLAGAQSLPRATLGQMAVRIALQCSESDAVLILSDDNTAARLISRPGEAIYNDAGGLLEGNQPFQVAYLNNARQRVWLDAISTRDRESTHSLTPPIVFEGNRPSRWTAGLADSVWQTTRSADELVTLLGESVELGPPTSLVLRREAGRNAMVVGLGDGLDGLLGTIMAGISKRVGDQVNESGLPIAAGRILYFDGGRSERGQLASWLRAAGIQAQVVSPRDCEAQIVQLAAEVQRRADSGDESNATVVAVIDPLERFRDLRNEESFSFSLDAAGQPSGGESLQRVLRDGPAVGVFTVLVCSSAEALTRWLPRSSRHDLQQRILGRINASDSSNLIDSPDAAALATASMLLYDDADGSLRKFRVCDLPEAEAVKRFLGIDQELPSPPAAPVELPSA